METSLISHSIVNFVNTLQSKISLRWFSFGVQGIEKKKHVLKMDIVWGENGNE